MFRKRFICVHRETNASGCLPCSRCICVKRNIVSQTGLINLGMATSLGEGKLLNSDHKIDFVTNPDLAEWLMYKYKYIIYIYIYIYIYRHLWWQFLVHRPRFYYACYFLCSLLLIFSTIQLSFFFFLAMRLDYFRFYFVQSFLWLILRSMVNLFIYLSESFLTSIFEWFWVSFQEIWFIVMF